MDAATFRSHPLLRASAYQLATWALAGVLISIVGFARAAGSPWPAAWAVVYAAGVIVGAALISVIHRRRVNKMYGPAVRRCSLGRRLWASAALLAAVVSVSLIGCGRRQFVEPVWLLVGGGAYAAMSRFGPGAYKLLAVVFLVGGSVVLGLQDGAAGAAPSAAGLAVLDGILLGVALPVAVYVNRRYLWAWPATAGSGE